MLTWILFRPEGEGGSGGSSGEGDGNGDSGTGDSGTGAPGGQGTQPGAESKDQMVPASELSKIREEAAKHRTELRKAQKRIEELEGETKSDVDKLVGERDKVKSDLTAATERARKLQVQVLAGNVGIADPQAKADAANLLDWEGFDDPDDQDEIEKALKKLVKDRPYLLGNVAGGADGGAGTGRSSDAKDMNALIRERAGRT